MDNLESEVTIPEALKIRRVNNGFIVYAEKEYRPESWGYGGLPVNVFRSALELANALRDLLEGTYRP